MCGIAGMVSREATPEQLTPALELMAHRGPDGQGIFFESPVVLGHVRLAIQDLSAAAAQPMISADGRYVLVYNGELYNHPELRRELEAEGVTFVSSSDTETLLQGYIRWGADLLPKLNGMFAFAVYDREQRMLFLARDHFGIKPLYYYQDRALFLFASELKALLPIKGWKRDRAAAAFQQALLLQWQLGAQTGFAQVHKLLPGHCLSLSLDQPEQATLRRWYRFPMEGRYTPGSIADWVPMLDTALRDAVKRQLLSDKPIAAFLSGGLDSSLLVAIARDHGHALPCFSIDASPAFRKEGFAADLPYARKLATEWSLPLHVIDAQAEMLQDLDRMIWQLDEIQGDPAPLFVGLIADAARAGGYEVMIGGVGGDDLFSGYRRHQALAMEALIGGLPQGLRKGLAYCTERLPDRPAFRRLKKLGRELPASAEARMAAYFRWAGNDTVRNLMGTGFRDALPEDPVLDFLRQLQEELPADIDPLNRMLYAELHGFLPGHNLNYTDKMGMMHGVEIRVPYLDIPLAESSARIPPALKLKGTQTKYLLKKVAERYLPEDVIYRPKTGFGAPLRHWVKEDVRFRQMIRERLTDPSFLSKGIFDAAAVEQLVSDTLDGTYDGAYTLLALLAAESWLRQFS